MSKLIDIECTAEIFIDEYAEHISDNVLILEAIDRMTKIKNKKLKSEFNNIFCGLDNDEIVDLIASIKGFNIIQCDKLKTYLDEL